jgi:membrane protein YdbS with pleckstrin-like domain
MMMSKMTLGNWLSLFTILVMVSISVIVFVSDVFQEVLPSWRKFAFAGITLMYAIIRINRIKNQLKSEI